MTPRSPEKRQALTSLYLAGMPLRLIAERIGGTQQGIRSTIRKMRERQVLPARSQPNWREWMP